MGVILGVWVSLLLSTASLAGALNEPQSYVAAQPQQFSLPMVSFRLGDYYVARWERRLRNLSIYVLRSTHRWSIRFSRLAQSAVVFMFGGFLSAAFWLLFAGLISGVDRRILVVGWQKGLRAALGYMWIGFVVFLRLLRDPRVAGHLRLVVPLAVLDGAFVGKWVEFGDPLLDPADEVLVVVLASRWFVRSCPEEIVAQHALQARERVASTFPYDA